MEKTIRRKFETILLILFWVWVALFAMLYIISSGATTYRRDKLIPWLKELWGIVRRQPAAIERLNSHARQAILSHINLGDRPNDPQSHYFSRWNAAYLRFQRRANYDIRAAHAKAILAQPISLSFTELYRGGHLKIAGASTSQTGGTSLLLKPSTENFRVEVDLPSPLRAIAIDRISISGSMKPRSETSYAPFSDYVRIFWLGAPANSRELSFSGERSYPVDLRGFTEKGVASAYLDGSYLWLSGGYIKRILLEFNLSAVNEVSLERLEFSTDSLRAQGIFLLPGL